MMREEILDLKLVVKDFIVYSILSCLLERVGYPSFGVVKYDYVFDRVSNEYYEIYGKKLTRQQFSREYKTLVDNKIIFEVHISEKRKKVGRPSKEEAEFLGESRKLIGVNPYITQELNELLSKRCEKLIKILTRFLSRFEKHKEKVELETSANEKEIIERLKSKLDIFPDPPLTLEKLFKPFIDLCLNLDFIEYQDWEWDLDARNNLLTIYIYFRVIKQKMSDINVDEAEDLLSSRARYLSKVLEEEGIKNARAEIRKEHDNLYILFIEANLK